MAMSSLCRVAVDPGDGQCRQPLKRCVTSAITPPGIVSTVVQMVVQGRVLLASSEREAERVDAGVEELDLEPSIRDRLRLPDQLIHPVLDDRAIAAGVDITALRRPCDLTIEPHAKWHARSLPRRSHDEV